MEFITIFFIVASIIVLWYFVYSLRGKNKLPVILDILFFGVYACVLIIFIYPPILSIIQDLLGLQSAINFIIYCGIFMLFLLSFNLYQRDEKQRQEISKLNREIALLKDDKRNK